MLNFKCSGLLCTALASVLLFSTGCSSTEVLAYEGPDFFEGKGGAKKVVDGIDLWQSGEPYGKFKIISILDDSYYTSGNLLANSMGQSSAQKRLVKAAKKAGADGVIILSRDSRFLGSSTTSSYTGSVRGNSFSGYGSSHSVSKSLEGTRAALVKYLK